MSTFLQKKIKIGVIGGGPSGISTAIALKKYGFEVIVIESDSFNTHRTGEHLAAEALHEFKVMGIPEHILYNNSIPCTEVKTVWGNDSLLSNESIFNPYGNGYVLSRPSFDEALFNYANSIGIVTYKNIRVQKVLKKASLWQLHCKELLIEADFIIDASGRNSKFKLGENIKKVTNDQLIGITKSIKPNTPIICKDSYVLIEASANGWWYSVQVSTGELIVTFMTDAKNFTISKLNKESFWLKELTDSNYTKKRVYKIEGKGEYSIKSAHSQVLNKVNGNDWLAVGDAAISYDPLSSAGIIKGIKIGQLAAKNLYEHYSGKSSALQSYNNDIQAQFKEYLSLRTAFYKKEIRWENEIFWIKRNFKTKLISNFSIYPTTILRIANSIDNLKIAYIKDQYTGIDINLLIKCIDNYNVAKDAIANYLHKKEKKSMDKTLFYALEELKIIGLIKQVNI